jgi:hypothetical protein
VELETVGVLRAAIGLYESFGFRPFASDHRSAGARPRGPGVLLGAG